MITEIKNNIKSLPSNIDHWIVAYSGGVDSCVLADILYKIKPENIRLSILHVNHGLSQDDAVNWAEQAKNTAKLMNAEFLTKDLNIEINQNGLEEKARNLRYDFISSNVSKNSVVFMGHHQNDQAETLLFRLFRGTGIKGLSAIPMKREIGDGILFRPMLTVSRNQIVEYANNNDIHWFEDDSNIDTQFSRNFIRHDLIPIISSRWPKILDQLSSLTIKAKECHDLNIEIAEEDFNKIYVKYKGIHHSIDCKQLHSLSDLRKKNVISYVFENKLGLNIESKTLKNALNILLLETDDFSKVRILKVKNGTIFNNGKNIWFTYA